MKKTLLALALTVASSSSFANEMFNMEGAKKSATVGFASVGDYSGVKFGGRIDLTSDFYAEASYFTVSGDVGTSLYSSDVDMSQFKIVAGKEFPIDGASSYWLAHAGIARISTEISTNFGDLDDSKTDVAFKLGRGWNFTKQFSMEGYLASEGGDTFIGGFAKYEINEKFDVTFEYNLYSDAHMFIMATYKF